MTNSFETKDQQQVWQVIRAINDAWLKGHAEDLIDYFHDDMVIVTPDGKEQGKGKVACVQSYKGFSSMAITKEFKEKDPSIQVYGNTAIAGYTFEMTYEMNGKSFDDVGRDIFVLIREEGKWLAVWRTIITLSPEKE